MNTAVKWFGIIAMLAITMVAVAGSAFAIPVSINDVRVDDTTLNVNSVTLFDQFRDSKMDIRVDFVANADLNNVEIEAFLSGYEYNDVARISASTPVFDVKNGVQYVKRLSLSLPDDLEQDDYKLRIIVSDRNGAATIQDYNLQIEGERHVVKIMDVTLSDSHVKPGSALLATVRVENQGQNEEQDIKISVSVPELGISASDYIDSIKSDKQKDSEELYLRIPKCAKEGIYQLKSTVSYNRDHETVTQSTPFWISSDDNCTPTVVPTTTTTVVVQQQPPVTAQPVETSNSSGVKTALEVILLTLIGLIVVIGIVLGLSRMGDKEDEAA